MKIHRVGHYDKFWELPELLRKFAAAGIGRLVHHALNNPFAIVSAQQGQMGLTPGGRSVNKEKDKELRDLLRHFDIGFFQMKGMWKDDELQKFLPEDSVFVIGIDEKDAKTLAELYHQEAYIWGDNGHYWLKSTETGDVWQEGDVAEHFRTVDVEGDPGFGYSKVKERPWIFDPNTPERSKQLREELEKRRAAPQEILKEDRDIVASANPQWFFCAWEKRPKYATYEGIVKEGAMPADVPNGGALSAFFRLILDETP